MSRSATGAHAPNAKTNITSLTTNPFSSRCVIPGEIKFVDNNNNACGTAEIVWAKLTWCYGWGQIVGPHGSGKTTLVMDVIRVAEQCGATIHHCTLRDKTRTLTHTTWDALTEFAMRKVSNAALIVIDGFEQLSLGESLRARWCYAIRKATPRCGGLLITTHTSAWCVPVLYTTRPSLEITTQVVASILGSQVDKVLSARIVEATPGLHHRHHGNVRLVLRDLYDIAEDFQHEEEKTT